MAILSIIWDEEDEVDDNYHHIVTEGHGIAREEVDYILHRHYADATTSHTSGNLICFGWTELGHYIAVVFERASEEPLMLYPITAYEAPPRA